MKNNNKGKMAITTGEEDSIFAALGISEERTEELISKLQGVCMGRMMRGETDFRPSALIEEVSELCETPAELAGAIWLLAGIMLETTKGEA